MPDWFVHIEVDERDRDYYGLLMPAGMEVVQRDDVTYLRSDELDAVDDRAAAERHAVELVRRASGLATLADCFPLRYIGLARRGHDGSIVHTVGASLRIGRTRIRTSAGLSDFAVLMSCAAEDVRLGRGLDILGSGERGWADLSWEPLYKLLELVEQDLGAKGLSVQAMGWASRNKQERFERTAQSYELLGDEARHARIRPCHRSR